MNKLPELFEMNRRWAGRTEARHPGFFSELAAQQAPKFLWIGCSDSRVPAEEVTGTEPGELFVHRNIANLVIHTDFNMLSVLQYAVEVLGVRHVIVCGHYGCGGVRNAMSHRNLGLINKWLRNIKDVYRFHKSELDAIESEEVRYRRLVELNVIEQVNNLADTSIVQKAWYNHQRPMLHGWVYDLETGLLQSLAEVPPGNPVDPIYSYDFT